ncbi:MAG: transketolase family protein [Defluviitaleaceae bacterium]|nr:transketolase family protein [Defluviitaleaceae bacterium]
MVFANQREAFGQALVDMGKKNTNLVVLDADLGGSTMGKMFETEFPTRHFEVGIAEANMVSISAGLALTGKIPFASSFAVFASGRVFDQIRQSVCVGNVNVKICGSSSGLSDFGDGATHQAVEDIAIMRALPNMVLLSPSDPNEAYQATIAAANYNGPVYLRISRNDYPSITDANKPFVIGEPTVIKEGKDIVIFATGYMVGLSLKAAEALSGRISVKVVNVSSIKPLNNEKIIALAEGCKAVITVEEHSIIGGLGSAVTEAMRHKPLPTEFIGVADTFGRSAHAYEELLEYFGLTENNIKETIIKMNGE